jgi:hypothetical protein
MGSFLVTVKYRKNRGACKGDRKVTVRSNSPLEAIMQVTGTSSFFYSVYDKEYVANFGLDSHMIQAACSEVTHA